MKTQGPIHEHTLSLIVTNEPGVLARVIGLFAGRGYNIESLTVASVAGDKTRSRITLVTQGTEMVIEQIKAQLSQLVPIHKVADLTSDGAFVSRELALIKVQGVGDNRVEALRLADTFRARTIDATRDSFIFELTGRSSKLNAFVDLMKDLGLVELARTGAAALSRGRETI